MKKILDFYNQKPQCSESVDEDWQRHLSQFLSICAVYKTRDVHNMQLLAQSLQPASTADQLLQYLFDSGVTSWLMIMERFSSRFYNEATRKRILNRLSNQTEDKENNEALKCLVTDIGRFCAMVSPPDRTFQERKRFLKFAIHGTEWANIAREKTRNSDNIGSIIETLHEAIDFIASLNVASLLPMRLQT